MTETPGLRERKKARTRWAIQEEALKLFREQGYQATTIDQIAAAADISPSTFFRYFPTKEDVVVEDAFDDLFVTAFGEAGKAADPVAEVRRIMAAAMSVMPANEWEKSEERAALVLSEPALRARSIDNLLAVSARAMQALAESAGRPADDVGVAAVTGAVMGVIASVAMSTAERGRLTGLGDRLDTALARLEGVDWFGDPR
jgi:AcrR family transcriptional regulator